MRQRGQVTFFLAVTLAVIMALIAFVVNVGLFVKAKINLQNAVDAAAWAGAAVQARQLTNIAYLNWEMRNTYKEWMFKYYILGNMALNERIVNSKVNYRLKPFTPGSGEFDRFNVPTICVHHGTEHAICQTASVPGLPRFQQVGTPGIDDHLKSMVNKLVASKASDCSVKSLINFGTAMLWAYGTEERDIFHDIPQIAAHRPGAWTQAIELALRMRNLEMIVNYPPISEKISHDTIESVENVSTIPAMIERPSKAFWSAFRNLGGGDKKLESPLLRTFALTELKPTPLSATSGSLSGFLIPEGNGRIKHYLDLQAYSLNLATFYTNLVSVTADDNATPNPSRPIFREGECHSSKVGLPVPGYVMGFVKNPAVLTYYAVKGEASYVGLFFPFTNRAGIKLNAYAAAKPFGGKIGPRLFGINPNGLVTPRQDARMTRTAAYVSGFDTRGFNGWKAGLPLPLDQNFWVIDRTNPIGGTPIAGNEIYFGVPNLIYDFNNISDIAAMNTGDQIETLNDAANQSRSDNPEEDLGLYNQTQHTLFRGNLAGPAGTVMTPDEVNQSLNNARRPTRYEAMNYLIPTKAQNDGRLIDTQHLIPPQTTAGACYGADSCHSLYAPLHGPSLLFENVGAITNVISSYLDYSKPAIQKFLDALKEASDSMCADSAAARGKDAYTKAAALVHSACNGSTSTPLVTSFSGSVTDGVCKDLSMAQKFHQFFNGTSQSCGITPLKLNLEKYFNSRTGRGDHQNFYTAPYTPPTGDLTNATMMAGYVPGRRQGASEEGEVSSPFPGGDPPALSKRNYYSTKFFAIEKIVPGGNHHYNDKAIYLERGDLGATPGDLAGIGIRNTLPVAELAEFGRSPPH